MEKDYVVPEGFQVYGTETICYYKDGVLYTNVAAPKILVADSGDLDDLKSAVPIGSMAFTASGQQKWMLGLDGEWVEMDG